MKLAVWLLLLINLVVFAYFHLAGAKPKVTLVGNQPVQPEKIQLLSDREIAQLPRKNLKFPRLYRNHRRPRKSFHPLPHFVTNGEVLQYHVSIRCDKYWANWCQM